MDMDFWLDVTQQLVAIVESTSIWQCIWQELVTIGRRQSALR